MFVSPDQGNTWGWRGCVIFPDSEFNEHMVVERTDNAIWMLSRTKYGIGESFSTDSGATWSAGFLVDERHRISYPDVALSPDGYLYIQYDRNRDEDGEILFARITEKDIISGTVSSERSALRKIVSRPGGKQA